MPDFLVAVPPFARKFFKFCLVGGSGVVVDMGVLFLLADPRMLGLNITLSKICAAEVAMINNFIWNELWTFRSPVSGPKGTGGSKRFKLSLVRRLLLFNAICGIGIGLAVALLKFFHNGVGLDLYLSNLLAIVLVTAWNFGLNARFNWSSRIAARCVVFAFLATQLCSQARVMITGVVSYEAPILQNTNAFVEAKYKVFLDGTNWVIAVAPTKVGSGRPPLNTNSVLYRRDGAFVQTTFRDTTGLRSRSNLLAGVFVRAAIRHIMIFDTIAPPYNDSLTFPAWLTYVGVDYLATNNDLIVPNLLAMSDDPQHLTRAQSNRLLRVIVERDAAERFASAKFYFDPQGNKSRIELERPFGVFRIISRTNVLGKSIPTESELITYGLNADQLPTIATRTVVHYSTIEDALPPSEWYSLIPSNAMTSVDDYRMPTLTEPKTHYFTTSHVAFAIPDQRLERARNTEIRIQQHGRDGSKHHVSKSSLFAGLVVLLLISFPIGLLVIKQKNQKHSK